MTFGELKSTIFNFRQTVIKIREIERDDDLSRNQKKELLAPLKAEKKQLETVLNKYENLFSVSAKVFEKNLKDVLSKFGLNNDAVELSVKEKMIQTGYEAFEGFTNTYYYDTRLDLVVDGKTEQVLLTWNREKSLTVDEFMLHLAINILPMIKDIDLKYSEYICNAGIETIAETLVKPKVEQMQENNAKQQESLTRRLTILTDPNARNEEIKKVTGQLTTLSNERENLEKSHDSIELV